MLNRERHLSVTFKAYFGIVKKVATYVSERTHREADRVLRDIKQSLSATVAPKTQKCSHGQLRQEIT
jgi:hypothetical protein